MIKELKNFLMKKENINKVWLLVGILIILAISKKDIPIISASIFGIYSGFLTFGFILVSLGALLTFIPGTRIIGIIAIVAGILISGGSIWAFFSSLPQPFGIPIWAFIMIGIILFVIFRKKIARRYTY